MQDASDLDDLYGQMLLSNRNYGWARLFFQKNLARWKTWKPQTPDTAARLKAAQDNIAECDRRIRFAFRAATIGSVQITDECSASRSSVLRPCSHRAASQHIRAQIAPAIQPARTSLGQWTPRYTRLTPTINVSSAASSRK